MRNVADESFVSEVYGVHVKAKRFKLEATEIKPLAPGRGSCIATDMITVRGEKVGYMYRESPDVENEVDSGWRFFSGTEDDAYANDPDNLQIYDVNTIANYDREIIPFLDAPAPVAFARDGETGAFAEVEAPAGEGADVH
jgi:hypothetical protein